MWKLPIMFMTLSMLFIFPNNLVGFIKYILVTVTKYKVNCYGVFEV